MAIEDDINRIMVEIDQYSEEIMVDAAITLSGMLKTDPRANSGIGTPIDTGYASNKWDFATTSLPGRIMDPRKITQSDVAAAAAASQQGLISLGAYTIDKGSIFVFNDTNYISILNTGSSQQAPSMFVEQAVDRMVSEINARYGSEVRRI